MLALLPIKETERLLVKVYVLLFLSLFGYPRHHFFKEVFLGHCTYITHQGLMASMQLVYMCHECSKLYEW